LLTCHHGGSGEYRCTVGRQPNEVSQDWRCSAIAERPRCRVRCSFHQTGTGRQYFTDIIALSSTTVI